MPRNGRPKKGVPVDEKTMDAILSDKAQKVDENHDMPIPNDGIDHMRWPPEARRLALLYCDPEHMKSTHKELAEASGYSLRSVTRYLNDPEFIEYCNQIANRIYANKLYPIFVAGMERGLREGNPKFYEMFMKSRGMLREVREVKSDVTVNDQREKATAELDDEIDRLERETGLVN